MVIVGRLVEGTNRLLIDRLRRATQGQDPDKWTKYLDEGVIDLNHRVVQSHGFRPVELMFGFTPRRHKNIGDDDETEEVDPDSVGEEDAEYHLALFESRPWETSNITNETQLSDEFYGFVQRFYSVFKELSSKNLYITGESYAGYYIPYIANRLLTASATEKSVLPLNLKGLLINDGVYSSFIVSEQIPVYRFVKANQKTLGFTDLQVAEFALVSNTCGYENAYKYLTYPPKGKIPLPILGNVPVLCDQFSSYLTQAQVANSCFNVYRITDKCPTPNDPIETYFSRPDVQAALHVPNFGQWSECASSTPFMGGTDTSPFSETLFPSILKQIPITLWHGLIDSVLFSDGNRFTIQNLTWNGMQGWNTPLIVDGQQKGIYHSERGLTYLEINNAGHMIPEDQPETALHVLQYVLGQGTL